MFYLIGKADGLFTPDYMLFALIAGLMLGVAGALFRRGSSGRSGTSHLERAFCG